MINLSEEDAKELDSTATSSSSNRIFFYYQLNTFQLAIKIISDRIVKSNLFAIDLINGNTIGSSVVAVPGAVQRNGNKVHGLRRTKSHCYPLTL